MSEVYDNYYACLEAGCTMGDDFMQMVHHPDESNVSYEYPYESSADTEKMSTLQQDDIIMSA